MISPAGSPSDRPSPGSGVRRATPIRSRTPSPTVPRSPRASLMGGFFAAVAQKGAEAVQGISDLLTPVARHDANALPLATPQIGPLNELEAAALGGVEEEVTIDVIRDRAIGEKIPSRTRFDLLRYAGQLTEAGHVALDQTYIALADFAAAHGSVISGSGHTEYVQATQDLQAHSKELVRSPLFSGLTSEQLAKLDSTSPLERRHAIQTLRQAYRLPVSSDQTAFIHGAEEQLRQTQVVTEDAAHRLVDAFVSQVRANTTLSPEEASNLLRALEEIRRLIPKRIGKAREEIIHGRKEWSGRPIEYDLTLEGKSRDQTLAITSAFRAAGPPKSSVCARNQRPGNPIVPNFFETTLKISSASQGLSSSGSDSLGDLSGLTSSSSESISGSTGSSMDLASVSSSDNDSLGATDFMRQVLFGPELGAQDAFVATRSSILVEFGSDDPVERSEVTQENVKVVLDRHANRMIDSADLTENSEENPLVVPYEQLLLLTPDLVRNMGAALSSSLVFRADDERLLVEESIAANRAWDGRVVPYTKEIDGVPTTVWVRFDISTFNIPCNKLQERLVSGPVGAIAAVHEETDQINQESFAKMTDDVNVKVGQIREGLMEGIAGLGEAERAGLETLEQLTAKKRALRLQIEQYVLRGDTVPHHLMVQYSMSADLVASEAQLLASGFSEQGKQCLIELQRIEVMLDLHADLVELIGTRAYMNPEVLDGNRYAIGSRVLVLGQLLGRCSHFGCRSGKDRTGLQDDDVKQLIAETILAGRVPAYFEAETWKSHRDNTQIMLRQSGNGDFNPRANLGGLRWYNVGGAQRTRKETHDPAYGRMVSLSKVYKRPGSPAKRQAA